ncbi:hypothetical protein GCM10028803_54270 [Larkinella knui]|uniref:DUF4249 domain-containing protein n=1 Tax=Larkinella knui TaxID=2025310 RepID=A0A3P1CGH6_9BACT|nr:DUF4249 domain-containing protein [Larkinella knui]RRB12367.1 DUF4249 domain-containing protein [Larkinella knui]
MRKGKTILIFLLLGSCVDPYRPPEILARNTYLVVDGFLNGSGVSSVRLSRTQNLPDGKKPTVETKASVKVEGEKGESQTFIDQGDGIYALANGGLQVGQKYRLSIRTAAGRTYASDYITIKKTPEIDTVSWKAQDQGIQFYVTTHDPDNNTKYYRWNYEETWEFYSSDNSQFEYLKKAFVYRQENIYHCWRTEKSPGISVGSSTQLTQDVINKFPLVVVSNSASNRLRIRYSLLVRQYALTQEAFEYWQNLKKNTESLGSIFDPQPFQVIGNIHGVTDPTEPVVGYLGGYTVEEKRIFVNSTELPTTWRIPTGYESCRADTFLLNPPPTKVAAADMADAGWLPISGVLSPTGVVYAYLMGPPSCVDCRTFGTTTKPGFW